MSRITTLALASLVALALTSGAAQSASEPMHPKLVRTIMDAKLGEVLTTSNRQAIYVWRSEPRGTIRCTGSCARAWPPVRVAKGVTVPKSPLMPA